MVVVKAKPDVYNHNIRNSPSLYHHIRPSALFSFQVEFFTFRVKQLDPMMFTKSE